MKLKIEARSLTVRLNDSILAFFQYGGLQLQLYMPGFIDAMDVAERGREQVSATDRIEAACHFQRVLGRCAELRELVTDDIVLFAAPYAEIHPQVQLVGRL